MGKRKRGQQMKKSDRKKAFNECVENQKNKQPYTVEIILTNKRKHVCSYDPLGKCNGLPYFEAHNPRSATIHFPGNRSMSIGVNDVDYINVIKQTK